MSLYPKGWPKRDWTLAEIRKLIKNARNVYVRVACEDAGAHEPSIVIDRNQALRLFARNRPRPKFMAWGDGDVRIG